MSRDLAALRNAAAERLTLEYGQGFWSAAVTDRGMLATMRRATVYIARHRGRAIATLTLSTRKPWAIDRKYFAASNRPLNLTNMAVAPNGNAKALEGAAWKKRAASPKHGRVTPFVWMPGCRGGRGRVLPEMRLPRSGPRHISNRAAGLFRDDSLIILRATSSADRFSPSFAPAGSMRSSPARPAEPVRPTTSSGSLTADVKRVGKKAGERREYLPRSPWLPEIPEADPTAHQRHAFAQHQAAAPVPCARPGPCEFRSPCACAPPRTPSPRRVRLRPAPARTLRFRHMYR